MPREKTPAIPDSITVQVSAVHPGHGTYGYAELLEGVVATRHGPAAVTFLVAQRLAGDVAESAKFAISFRTENHSDGVTYRVDAAELLGGIVRAYFEVRRNDRPLAEDQEGSAEPATE
ncbi:MAG: hypothetical protein ABR499_16025 [Gemmatimonadaceae bacterium]